MLLNIKNINTRLINRKEDEIDKESIELFEKMGAFIPKEDELYKLAEQNNLIEQNEIYQHIQSIKKKCSNVIDYKGGEQNLHIVSLNPNYSFALENLNGVVGYNIQNNNYLLLHLEENKNILDNISSLFVHEYHHVIRYLILQDNNIRKKNLIDYIIEEGLAENFVVQVLGKSYLNPWATQLSIEEINSYQEFLINHLYDEEPKLIYSALFGDQVEKIPLWLGYNCGFYFIKYLLQHRKKDIIFLTEQKREYFIPCLSDFFEHIRRKES